MITSSQVLQEYALHNEDYSYGTYHVLSMALSYALRFAEATANRITE